MEEECYCVCHSPVSSRSVCEHCRPAVEIAVQQTRQAEQARIIGILEGMKRDALKHPIQYHPDYTSKADGHNQGYDNALQTAINKIKE